MHDPCAQTHTFSHSDMLFHLWDSPSPGNDHISYTDWQHFKNHTTKKIRDCHETLALQRHPLMGCTTFSWNGEAGNGLRQSFSYIHRSCNTGMGGCVFPLHTEIRAFLNSAWGIMGLTVMITTSMTEVFTTMLSDYLHKPEPTLSQAKQHRPYSVFLPFLGLFL